MVINGTSITGLPSLVDISSIVYRIAIILHI